MRFLYFSKWNDWGIYHVGIVTVLLVPSVYMARCLKWGRGGGHQEKGHQACHMQIGQVMEVRPEKDSAYNSNWGTFWDQPQANHQIQELGDKGVWGLSPYPGLSGKRISFPLLYSVFFPLLFTSLLAMNPCFEISMFHKKGGTEYMYTKYTLFACMWMKYLWKYTCKPRTVVVSGRGTGNLGDRMGEDFSFYISFHMFLLKFWLWKYIPSSFQCAFLRCWDQKVPTPSQTPLKLGIKNKVLPIACAFMSCKSKRWKWVNTIFLLL